MNNTNQFLHRTNIMNYFQQHYFSLYNSSLDHGGKTHNVPVYYGIQYNHAGRFFLSIDHAPRQIYEGSYAFITHPNAWFDYGNLPGETRHHNFICSYGERVESYIKSGLLPISNSPPVFKINDPEYFLDTMTRIMALLRKSAPLTPPRAVLLYEDLLLQLHESAPVENPLPAYQEEYFRHLASAIRHHPEQSWDFNAEAAKRGLTLTHFRRLFKTMTGVPPLQFLNNCRLELAARMLVETTEPVSLIAEWAGIDNEYYFSRIFKEKYQLSPLRYRREFVSKSPPRQ